MTDQTDDRPEYEKTDFIYPFFADLMKMKKAAIVQLYVNPPATQRTRWIGGAHHPSKWRKEEVAWSLAEIKAREAWEDGKTGI